MAIRAEKLKSKEEVPALAPLPRHVAIIMDGNRRWAAERGLSAGMGHRKGVEAIRRVVRAAHRTKIKYVTLYGFSLDNWERPRAEVAHLMMLMRAYIQSDLAELHRHGVRIRMLGLRTGLPEDITEIVAHAEELTRENSAMTLAVAFNYGGRDEIVRVMQRLASEVKAGRLAPEEITHAHVEHHLDTAGMPPPDLVMRTSGEKRLSDFLIWQNAYAEFVFRDEFWPDVTEATFAQAIDEYRRRERRFGACAPPEPA